MSAPLDELPFIDIYVRLDGDGAPMFRSKERGKGNLNQFVPEQFFDAVARLVPAVRAALEGRPDGTLNFEGMRLRLAQKKMADESVWACGRRINIALPELASLGFAPHICEHLHSLGRREGLILISGSAGHGKTTTGVGLLVDYMRTYGGTAITIEDPVEYLLAGRHGDYGHCFQIEVESEEDWAIHLKHSLRWAPRFIYVGEIRTPKAAEQLLRAATTGHTVMTTLHGGTPEEALTGLLFLAEQAMGPGAPDVLAGSLTALMHQTMRDEGPFVRYLFTEENAPGDPIRSLIRENKIGMLSTYIDRIAARLSNKSGFLPDLPPRTPPKTKGSPT